MLHGESNLHGVSGRMIDLTVTVRPGQPEQPLPVL